MAAQARRPSIMDAEMPPSALMAQDPMTAPGGPPASRPRARTNSTTQGPGNMEPQDVQETQNARAMHVLNRVKEKLTGHDFKPDEELTYIVQVDKLLIEATKLENLCQHYIGWCSFW
jgi:FKBP12-rapamycin complex-associated protein